MELHGHFKYGSKYSREFGIMLAHAETEHDPRISGAIETASMFSKRGKRNYYTRDDYSDSPISFDVEFLVDSDRALNLQQQRAIQKWLFYSPAYWPLYLDQFDDRDGENTEIIDGAEKQLYIKCRFTHPEKIFGNGGVAGYKATLEADSPFAWQDSTSEAFQLDGGESASSVVSLEIDTDINDYTYPKVIITTGSSGGDITISNNTDDPARLTSFTGLSPASQITMDGELGYISGQNYEKFSKKNFIRLLGGENMLSVVGDITSIQFEWQNRRYL